MSTLGHGGDGGVDPQLENFERSGGVRRYYIFFFKRRNLFQQVITVPPTGKYSRYSVISITRFSLVI